MYVHTAVLTFSIPDAMSLKDKRQVARRLLDRARRRLNISIAEVDTQEAHQVLTIGLALVSGDAGHARRSLDTVLAWLETAADAELLSVAVDAW